MAARKAAAAAEDKAVGFVPAVTFEGYPDGATATWYRAGTPCEAPAEYVDLLRAKGLLAVAAPESEEE